MYKQQSLLSKNRTICTDTVCLDSGLFTNGQPLQFLMKIKLAEPTRRKKGLDSEFGLLTASRSFPKTFCMRIFISFNCTES